MHVVLFLAGLLALAAGIVMLAFGIPIFQSDMANPLVVSATISILSGIILLGLGAIMARLRRIAEALDMQPVPRGFGVATAPALAPGGAAAIGTSAEPRVERPEKGSEQSKSGKRQSEPVSPLAATELPRPGGTERGAEIRTPLIVPAAGAVGEAHRTAATEWPRVDSTDRLAPAEARLAPAGTEAGWSSEQEPNDAGHLDADRDLATASDVQPTVLKSGVIEGIAYTLYSDGSVEAELPQGTMRFGSIAEWRVYMRALS